MKGIISILTFAFAVMVAFVPISNAEMEKQGTLNGTLTYAGSHKIIPLDKDRYVLSYENFGVRVSDSGDGPFHGMSTHNIGIIYYENGVGRLKGYLFNTDKDGDTVVFELTEDATQQAPKPTSGNGKIVGGTGKFKGITGDMKYTRRSLRPVAKGTHQAISKGTGNWSIVEPKE